MIFEFNVDMNESSNKFPCEQLPDNNTRFRKAVLRMKASDMHARYLIPKDIVSVWPFLAQSGSTPYDLAKEANQGMMTNNRLSYLLRLLNSYL